MDKQKTVLYGQFNGGALSLGSFEHVYSAIVNLPHRVACELISFYVFDIKGWKLEETNISQEDQVYYELLRPR